MQPNYDALYRALVTSNVDTSGLGRIKVQCPQIGSTIEIRSAEPINPQEPVPAVGSTVWLAFSGGDITKPLYQANTGYWMLGTDGTTVQGQSLASASRPDAVRVFLVSGSDSMITGDPSVPHISIRDFNADSDADLRVSGSVLKTNQTGTIYTWTTPTMGTGWATGTGIGGSYPPLNWHYDVEDNVHVFGTFHATSTTPNGIIATGFPAVSFGGNVGVGSATSLNVTNRVLPVYVNSAGELHAPILGTNAVNDTFAINVKIPLGHIS